MKKFLLFVLLLIMVFAFGVQDTVMTADFYEAYKFKDGWYIDIGDKFEGTLTFKDEKDNMFPVAVSGVGKYLITLQRHAKGKLRRIIPTLKAGAGSSPIVFPAEMFDPSLPNLEGFNGVVHDNPYARVLVLERDIKIAICSLELVNIPSYAITLCKNIVSAKTGTLPQNVWVHATHAITTPHVPGNADHAPTYDEVQATYYYTAVQNAISEAAEQAADTFQEAVAGFGTGYCDVNMNRDVMFADGNWYIGLGSTMPSNKTMTVLRVNSKHGHHPIGFLISYGIKPTCIDNSEMAAKTRQISSDVPGLACRLMEEKFGAPALFCMPAAADQVPRKWCWYQAWDDAQGKAVWVDEGVANGLEYVQELGSEMGYDAIKIAKKISCRDSHQKIAIKESSFTTRNKDNTADVEIAVGVIRFGDAAFVGFKPEMNCVTEQELWAESPYKHTLLISFRDGDQKYMPDASAYGIGTNEKGTAEAQKSGFIAGTAEKLVDTAIDLLDSLK